MATLQQLNLPGYDDDDVDSNLRWRIEGAKIFWCRGEKDTAMHLVKALVDKLGKVSMFIDNFIIMI